MAIDLTELDALVTDAFGELLVIDGTPVDGCTFARRNHTIDPEQGQAFKILQAVATLPSGSSTPAANTTLVRPADESSWLVIDTNPLDSGRIELTLHASSAHTMGGL